MKKSQLKQIIKEEIKNILTEESSKNWTGGSSSLEDFITIIKNLPEDIKSIEIPINPSIFNPKVKTFNSPIDPEKKKEIIDITKYLTGEFKKKNDPIYSYSLNSYYGNKISPEQDDLYIKIDTKQSDEFGDSMSKGGGLD
jgi:hypothetical protein